MSSSKSSQSSAQHYTDNRAVLGENSLYANNGASVTVLDGGAIQTAASIAESAIAGNVGALNTALSFGNKVLEAGKSQTDRALDNLQATQTMVAGAYEDAKGRGQWTDLMLIGAVAGSLLVAGLAVRGN
ncbi:MAG TPA: hypothetical protein VF522_13120 [Ramlibacter sp.]|uniref:hypothetical protein n=1 Tax=Ramlibacter sp. TaxID=1917967 RepID=UPI002ED50433